MNKIFAPFLPPWAETGLQPAFYDVESGTVLQQTARMYNKVNQLTRLFNEFSEATSEEVNAFEREVNDTVTEYIEKFTELKDFVDDYFDNLDVQEEINNKLDEMAEDGSLAMVLASRSYYVNPKTFGAVGDGETDDTQALQACIDYANTNQLAVCLDRKSYVITDSLTLYSNINFYGNGCEIKTEEDVPIFTSSEILHHVNIDNVVLTGADDDTYTSNNGIELVCYYSTFKNIEFKKLYRAIYLTHTGATGTLVENRIENCNVRSCHQGFYLGANNNNKITDGFISDCVISTNDETLDAIYIGSSAGWCIDGVHIYGTNKCGLYLTNGFHTQVSNVYVESVSTGSIVFSQMQTNCNLTNAEIVVRKISGIGISQSNSQYKPFGTPYLNATNINISGSSVATDSYGIKGASVNLVNYKAYSEATNFTDLDVYTLRYIKEAKLFDTLTYDTKRLSYADNTLSVIKKHFLDIAANTETSIRIKVPDTKYEYCSNLFRFRLLGFVNWNGTKNFDYESDIALISKNSVMSTKNITSSDVTNFASAPAVTYDGDTNEIVVTFTPSTHLYGAYYIEG